MFYTYNYITCFCMSSNRILTPYVVQYPLPYLILSILNITYVNPTLSALLGNCWQTRLKNLIQQKTEKVLAASPLSLSIFWAKKNNNSPWVWGLKEVFPFFSAQTMLRLSRLAANTFSVFCCIKFFNLVCQQFPSSAVQRVSDLQGTSIGDISGYTGPILKISTL